MPGVPQGVKGYDGVVACRSAEVCIGNPRIKTVSIFLGGKYHNAALSHPELVRGGYWVISLNRGKALVKGSYDDSMSSFQVGGQVVRHERF